MNRFVKYLHVIHFSLAAVLVVTTLLTVVYESHEYGSATAGTCSVSTTLVNSCRPWLGAAANGYNASSNFAAQIANHEARIGRQLDIVHDYRTPGQVLSGDDQSLAKRSGTILLLNWKPASVWADAAGGNATVNAQIDSMANSIKSLGSTKIMLTVFHEPENDISPGGDANCPNITYKGNSGSIGDYTAMWHNVRARFNALGVSNVVWVINYMGYSTWDCTVNDLWPGDDYVDWVMWDSYAYNTSDFVGTESRFYNYLLANSGGSHNYASKPWGLAEWGGLSMSSQSTVYSLYDNAKAAIDNNSLPKLKAYVIWDSNLNSAEDRTSYSASGALDTTEQDHYNSFADDPRFTDAFYGPVQDPPPPPPPTTPPPTGGGTSSGGNNATGGSSTSGGGNVSTGAAMTSTKSVVKISNGSIKVAPNATVIVDGKATPASSLSTASLTNGKHTVIVSANGVTKRVTFTVNNPWPLALKNEIEANPTAYTGATGTVLLVLVGLWLTHRRLFLLARLGMRRFELGLRQ